MVRFAFRNVLLLIAGLAVCQASAVKAATLQYKFKQGDVTRYEVKEKTYLDKSFLPGVDMNTDWDAVLVLKVLAVLPDGGAQIEASYDSGELHMLGQTHKMKSDEVAPLQFKVTNYGKILDLDAVANNPKASIAIEKSSDEAGNHESQSLKTNVYQSVLESLWQEFPSGSVKEGEKWTQEIICPILGDLVNAQSVIQKIDGKHEASIIRTINWKSPSIDNGASASVKATNKVAFSIESGQINSIKSDGKIHMHNLKDTSEEGVYDKNTPNDVTITYSAQITLLEPDAKK
jgi:hypothetical protein